MSPTGEVYPCEVLGYPEGERIEEWALGNVRDHDYDLARIVNSPRARAVCRRIETMGCHCGDACDLGLSLLRSPSFVANVLRGGIRSWKERRSNPDATGNHDDGNHPAIH